MTPMTARDILKAPSGTDPALRGPLVIVGIGLDAETGEQLRRFTESIPLVRLRAILHAFRDENYDSVAEWVGHPPPDVCIIDFDKDRGNAATAAERIHTTVPGTAIFAVSSKAQPELIIEAMRSGCTEYLVKPLNRDELLNALARVGGRQKQRKAQHHAQVMTF